MSRRLASLVVALVVITVSGCKKAVPEIDLAAEQPRVTLLQVQRDPSEVRAAIIGGIQGKGWVTESETGPEIIARLNHKGATVRVSIVYDATRFTVKGLEATDAKPKSYEGWVSNLEQDIAKRLRAPAPVVVQPAPAQVGATPAPTLVVFDREQKFENVKGAIQRALSQHSWVLEADEPAGLIARLNHKKGLVRVRITSTTQQATIAYVSSEGLSIDPATGVSDDYEKWMRNLVEAIRQNTR
ncbi:MAG: hypothetical protein ACO1OB_03870 [Archangium sp.]